MIDRMAKLLGGAAVVSPVGCVAADQTPPLAVSVKRACELSGLGATSVWAFIRDGRLKVVHVPGLRRTLITYESLLQLLAPRSPSPAPSSHRRRRRKAPAEKSKH
jgi:hypothetical protein